MTHKTKDVKVATSLRQIIKGKRRKVNKKKLNVDNPYIIGENTNLRDIPDHVLHNRTERELNGYWAVNNQQEDLFDEYGCLKEEMRLSE